MYLINKATDNHQKLWLKKINFVKKNVWKEKKTI